MARTVAPDRTSPMLEALESRRLLSVPDSPPALSLLDDPTNPVVRFETDLGRIDIEVLMNQAPLAGANFLSLLELGFTDLSFFHSLTPGETLGGGLYKLVGGSPALLSQPLTVESATPLTNTERTLAAPILGGSADETDGRWIINLSDSPLRDSQFIVFARVVAGWNVVQSIAALMTEDFTTAVPETSGLSSVPVLSAGAPMLSRAITVDIIDADQIKPQGQMSYWTQSIVYPEGFAGFGKREVLTINEITTAEAFYEVTIRYETGEFRDVVIDSGMIDGAGRVRLVLSDASDSMPDLVRSNTPYAIEVRALDASGRMTPAEEPLSATIERTEGFFRFSDPLTPDGADPTAAESFFNPAPYSNAELRTWVLGPVEGADSFTQPDGTLRVITRQSFITWLNLTPNVADVTVTFLGGGATPLTMNFSLDPLRRGGLAVHTELFDQFGVTSYFEGVRITSTQPIAVQFSGYAQILDTPPMGANLQYRSAFSSLALAAGGGSTGVLPTIGETVFVNAGATAVDISVEVVNADGLVDIFDIDAVQPGELVFGPDTSMLAPNAVAIRYNSTGPVGAFLLDEDDGLTRVTPFQLELGNLLHFAGAGVTSLADNWELGVYNPWVETTPTDFLVRFDFDDGTSLATLTLTFGTDGYRSLRLDSPELAQVRAKILSGATRFSVTVLSVDGMGTPALGSELGAILMWSSAASDDGSAMIAMPTGTTFPWVPGLMV